MLNLREARRSESFKLGWIESAIGDFVNLTSNLMQRNRETAAIWLSYPLLKGWVSPNSQQQSAVSSRRFLTGGGATDNFQTSYL